MGRALGLPFMAMTAWGDKWLGNGEVPLTLRSKATGQRLAVALVDERGKVAKASDVQNCDCPGLQAFLARGPLNQLPFAI